MQKSACEVEACDAWGQTGSELRGYTQICIKNQQIDVSVQFDWEVQLLLNQLLCPMARHHRVEGACLKE